MDTQRNAALFAILATLLAVSAASLAATKVMPQGVVMVVLVVMGLCLFAAGYYAGLSRSQP